jgi:hypothetical protein
MNVTIGVISVYANATTQLQYAGTRYAGAMEDAT